MPDDIRPPIPVTLQHRPGTSVEKLVGMRTRAARTAAGMTQEELGLRIGLGRSSIANLEAGRQDIGMTKLAALAQVLNLDLADLVRSGDLPPEPHKVTIKRVFEVECETCGIFDAPASRAAAVIARRDHIAQQRAAEAHDPPGGSGPPLPVLPSGATRPVPSAPAYGTGPDGGLVEPLARRVPGRPAPEAGSPPPPPGPAPLRMAVRSGVTGSSSPPPGGGGPVLDPAGGAAPSAVPPAATLPAQWGAR